PWERVKAPMFVFRAPPRRSTPEGRRLFRSWADQLGRGALAGLAGGAVPLGVGLCMAGYGHGCGGLGLIPRGRAVRASGSLVAGLWIAWVPRKQPSPLAFVFAASATA